MELTAGEFLLVVARAFHPDPPAVRFHNAFGKGKSETRAASFETRLARGVFVDFTGLIKLVNMMSRESGSTPTPVSLKIISSTLFNFKQFVHVEMTQVAETTTQMRADLKNLIEVYHSRLFYGTAVAVPGRKSSVGTGGGTTSNPSLSVNVKYVTCPGKISTNT